MEKKWAKESYCSELPVKDTSPLKLRAALLGLGRILEEDQDKLYWVTTVKSGGNEALVILKAVDGHASIAACAHEGLIFQNIAKKAVEIVSSRLK